MKKTILLCLLFMFAFYWVDAQDTSSIQLKPFTLHIAVDKKNFYEENIPAGRFVHPDNTVQLYPGEKIYLEAQHENGMINNLRAVSEIRDSSNTIIISFEQTAKKKVHEMMMLKVSNPFPQNLSYSAMIYLLDNKKWVPTSIIPVMPGLDGYETWTDIIISIGLGNFSLKE